MPKIDVATRPNKRKGIYGSGCYKNGFWQVALDDSSRFLTSFNTPFSGYRWKGMQFDIKSAPEVWQSKMTLKTGYCHFSIPVTLNEGRMVVRSAFPKCSM